MRKQKRENKKRDWRLKTWIISHRSHKLISTYISCLLFQFLVLSFIFLPFTTIITGEAAEES